ncbi:MAG: methyltransferase domain-containing protein [Bacteroidetes bacterium]|nr:methyltransferase domain-containing protein [Bacteroidota bacterium]MCY4205893.1 methyltransferase domain-containing protein [Bacteroidota bacterium]
MANLFEPEYSVKETVRRKYDAIAKGERESGYCMLEDSDYGDQSGYQVDADLGLGCGTPVDFADLKLGEAVLDLGSGAGLDAMIASPIVGDKGKVIGVDFAPEMIAKARKNIAEIVLDNISFIEGDIEQLPIEDSSIDVVISNCTLNLVPDKAKAFSEVFRVLRPGGRFAISDVVTVGPRNSLIIQEIEQIAGCAAGVAEMEVYLRLISDIGFKRVRLVTMRMLKIVHEHDGFVSLTICGKRPF